MALDQRTAPAADAAIDLGDPTLVGTQLQVIDQLQDGAQTFWFQITSAIGLDDTQVDDFLRYADLKNTAEAEALLIRAAGIDIRFAAMVNATHGRLFMTFADKGKDGLPNFRLVTDFAGGMRTSTFQIHTILSVKSEQSARTLEQTLNNPSAAQLIADVSANCSPIAVNSPLNEMLSAAVI